MAGQTRIVRTPGRHWLSIVGCAAIVAGCSNVKDLTQPSCAVSVSPIEMALGAAGGSGTLTVRAPGLCEWAVSGPPAWIHFGGTTSGTGDAELTFSVAPNLDAISRTGTIRIGDQNVNVRQGASTCTYDIAPELAEIGADGGTGAVTVTTNGACPWVADASVDWITLEGESRGTASSVLRYRVAPNASAQARTGSIAVTTRTFTLVQAGRPVPGGAPAPTPPAPPPPSPPPAPGPACDNAVDPPTTNVPASGGSVSFQITAASTCAWTAVSQAPWVVVTSGHAGSGDGLTRAAVQANTSPSSRIGTLAIAGRIVTVTQPGESAPACSYTATPDSTSFSSAGGSGVIALRTGAACAWTATASAGWLAMAGGTAGTGDADIAFTVSANPGAAPRTGSLSIADQVVTITQAGGTSPACTYSVSPSSISLDAGPQEGAVTLTTGSGCGWTAVSSDGWLTVDARDASGVGGATVRFAASRNTGDTSRTATLTVGGQDSVVTQQGKKGR